jgi:hypothetical protein
MSFWELAKKLQKGVDKFGNVWDIIWAPHESVAEHAK